jgi:carbamoyl-phosphate synthase small subunit
MNGMITTNDYEDKTEIIERLKAYRVKGVVRAVTCSKPETTSYENFTPTDFEKAKLTYMAVPDMAVAISAARDAGICEGETAMCAALGSAGINRLKTIADNPKLEKEHFKVALLDFGTKRNIEHNLLKRGCTVTVFPADTKAETILKGGFDGVMLSNGPGDPAECVEIIAEIKKLFDSNIPIFAICLGHQLMALANGFKTAKMKYGHRGANHPVKDVKSGRVYISTQNHGYMVLADSVNPEVAEIGFINANDNTVEGIRYKNKNVFTVQFHPEACGGPQDTEFLFDDFIKMMEVN